MEESGRTPNVGQVVGLGEWKDSTGSHHGTIQEDNRTVVDGIGQFLQG